MAESEKEHGVEAPRKTLKLKSPAIRNVAPAAAAVPVRPAPRVSGRGQEASWADEHKSRMQADMDALSAGQVPAAKSQRGR